MPELQGPEPRWSKILPCLRHVTGNAAASGSASATSTLATTINPVSTTTSFADYPTASFTASSSISSAVATDFRGGAEFQDAP